jgi:hypothetical protein
MTNANVTIVVIFVWTCRNTVSRSFSLNLQPGQCIITGSTMTPMRGRCPRPLDVLALINAREIASVAPRPLCGSSWIAYMQSKQEQHIKEKNTNKRKKIIAHLTPVTCLTWQWLQLCELSMQFGLQWQIAHQHHPELVIWTFPVVDWECFYLYAILLSRLRMFLSSTIFPNNAGTEHTYLLQDIW